MPEGPNIKLYTGTAITPPKAVAPCDLAYAELDVTTNFSFLRGASHPDELVSTAALLGYRAMAVTDVNSVAGVVRAYEAAQKIEGFKLIVGARLVFTDGTPDLLVWPTDREVYGRLCQLLTIGRTKAPKGKCYLTVDDFVDHQDGLLVAACSSSPLRDKDHRLYELRDLLGDRMSIAVSLSLDGDDGLRLDEMIAFGRRLRIPLLATNHVHYHDPARRRLQDVLTCVRHKCTIYEAGYKLFPNAERYLKSPVQMHALFGRHRQAIDRALEVARRCQFDLGSLKYEYPTEVVPPGCSPSEYLRSLTYSGAAEKYPAGVPSQIKDQIEKELSFICGSQYESYFLTVHDLVRFARSKNILCQGRGSAANSAVCYCLGVTSVDPEKFQLVFERFASGVRAEPPDIDVDFAHERREEVIQYVYERHGRDRAAMTASLATYRGRSAIRDVGKALGYGRDALDSMAGKLDWWHRGSLDRSQLAEAGIDPDDPGIINLIQLTTELLGFPRHLSQHPGGMVISRSPISTLVPIGNAAMKDRTHIEWDKDDLDALGMFKVDILGLGMLTVLSKSFKLIESYDRPYELHTIPHEDAGVYDMASDADTIGVFQIESRAQMSMLPRLKPKEFYDLVIEVAIVRPGPIQGDMVHPYLLRREGKQKIEYEQDALKAVLSKTLGVPLFQEQAMRIAMVAAGFSGAEADQLRRAMAAWKRGGGLGHFEERFIGGMIGNGYTPGFAERCFKQICGFGEYGFPESHAASFAKLVYASLWIKRYHPAAFCCALLNSQPMGFYAPAQLVRDAREHGVIVRPIDVNHSDWDCTLEHDTADGRTATLDKATWGYGGPAVRLGLRHVKGMRQIDAERISQIREAGGSFTSVEEFHHRTGINVAAAKRLAEADAFTSIEPSRRRAAWDALALTDQPAPLTKIVSRSDRSQLLLPRMTEGQEVVTDYSTTGLTLRRHPVSFVRRQLSADRILPTETLRDENRCWPGKWVKVAGLVLVRQRPGTASGVVFVTLEDETGIANLIVWADVYERYRKAARHATLLQAEGQIQREGKVIHIVAMRLIDRSDLLSGLHQPSRDFH